jgi:hypothetical protein
VAEIEKAAFAALSWSLIYKSLSLGYQVDPIHYANFWDLFGRME